MVDRASTQAEEAGRVAQRGSTPSDDVTRLEVRVIPRSRRDEVSGERAGRLIVRTTAPPVDDAANRAVRRLVAHHLGVPVRDVDIVRGHHGRDKTLEVRSRR